MRLRRFWSKYMNLLENWTIICVVPFKLILKRIPHATIIIAEASIWMLSWEDWRDCREWLETSKLKRVNKSDNVYVITMQTQSQSVTNCKIQIWMNQYCPYSGNYNFNLFLCFLFKFSHFSNSSKYLSNEHVADWI